MERLLHPIDDGAGMLGVGRTMIYELAKRHEIELVKIGRRSLITADSLNAYVHRLSATADSATVTRQERAQPVDTTAAVA